MDYKLFILVGKGRGDSFKLNPARQYNVGRHPDNDIRLLDKNISRNHFKISIKNSKYYITDLNSKNGTFVDGKDLVPGIETEVKEGIPILIGTTILGFGAVNELSLKHFLSAASFEMESSGYGEESEKQRALSMKKNLLFFYGTTNLFTDSRDIEEIIEKLLDKIFEFLKRVDRCVIVLVDNETGKINNVVYRSRKPVDDPGNIYNRELVERALSINKPVIVKDSFNTTMDDEGEKVTESLHLMKIRSAMCVPIAGKNGIRGAIYVDSLEMSNGFRTNDAFLLKEVSSRAGLAMDNISQEKSGKL